MSEAELSFQQRDPLASYALRPVTIVVSAAIVALATAGTIAGWSASDHSFAAFAMVAAVLVAVSALYWSSPLRAPFPTVGVVVMLLFAIATVVLALLSSLHDGRLEARQWPVVVFALSIAQLAPFRPVRDLVSSTILGTIAVSFATILVTPTSVGLPESVSIIGAALPILGVGLGAAEYARALSRRNLPWYSSTPDHLPDPAVARLVRSVRDDRVSILNHTVVPFFTEILEADAITASDRKRALVIANTIRAAMVAEVDRSWLDSILDDIAAARGGDSVPGSEVVQDPERLAVGMSTEQRIVIRAVVIALFDHPGFDPDGFAMDVAPEGGVATVTLTAKLDADDSLSRTGLAPYFSVLRIAFGDLIVTFQHPMLTLKFSYEHK